MKRSSGQEVSTNLGSHSYPQDICWLHLPKCLYLNGTENPRDKKVKDWHCFSSQNQNCPRPTEKGKEKDPSDLKGKWQGTFLSCPRISIKWRKNTMDNSLHKSPTSCKKLEELDWFPRNCNYWMIHVT